MRFISVCLLLVALCSPSEAQVLPYAKEVIQTLSSEAFKGRGYVESGDSLAAEYIKNEFRRFGLTSYQEDYFQHFRMSANTFPEPIHLSIDGESLTPGEDFLVFPGSPSISGIFESIPIYQDDLFNNETLTQKVASSPRSVLVMDVVDNDSLSEQEQQRVFQIEQFLRRSPNNPARANIILTDEKMSWFGATVPDFRPSFIVIKDSVRNPFGMVEVELKSVLNSAHLTQNVVGYVEGSNPDSTIIIMAHYDHFGKMGQALFPGANDNASGVAMLLSLARHFSENKPPYNIAFLAFGGEELGLLGAKYFTENPLFDLSEVKFTLNFDIAGTGDDGIQVVNGSVYREQFDELVSLNESLNLLPEVRIRGSACNSDHCLFDQLGIPGFYIYTLGGIRAYHDIYDRFETLPLTEFEDYFTLMVKFIEGL